MASLTEQLQEDAKKDVKNAVKAAKAAASIGKQVSKGIALILKGTVLSEDSIMKALDKKVENTGELQYSYMNVSVEELTKGGRVEKIDEAVRKEVMRYFDRYCREFGVKYSILKKTETESETKSETEAAADEKKEEIEDEFYIFFEGKNDKLIEHILKSAYEDWNKDKEAMKQEEKEDGKSAAKAPGERASVLAKLAFFRNRVKEHVEQEKNNQKDNHRERTQEAER